jgi:hypothetical protein
LCQTGIHSPEKRYSFPRNVKFGNKPAMTMGFTVALALSRGAAQQPVSVSLLLQPPDLPQHPHQRPPKRQRRSESIAPQSAAQVGRYRHLQPVKPNGFRLDPDVMEPSAPRNRALPAAAQSSRNLCRP